MKKLRKTRHDSSRMLERAVTNSVWSVRPVATFDLQPKTIEHPNCHHYQSYAHPCRNGRCQEGRREGFSVRCTRQTGNSRFVLTTLFHLYRCWDTWGNISGFALGSKFCFCSGVVQRRKSQCVNTTGCQDNTQIQIITKRHTR